MRVINRFIYAIVLALGLYTVFNVTHTRTLIGELQVIGQQELDNENINAFVTTRYSMDAPILETPFSMDDMVFDVYVFEVANVDNETLDIYAGIQIIMHQIEGETLELPMMIMINEDTNMIYEMIQIVGLPIYTVYPGAEETFFTEDTYPETTFSNLTFIKDDSIRGSLNIDVEVKGSSIKEALETYTLEQQSAPTESFESVIVSDIISINTTPRILLFSSIYIVVAGLITWFLFIKQPTRKGKQQAPHLRKNQ